MSSEAVLVIVDDKATRDSLQMFLTFEGFIISSSKCGADALDVTRKKRFDVLLICYRILEINGDELMRQLRSRCPDSFIIGFGIESKGQAFLRAGADAFVRKDKVVHELVPLIRNRIRR
ncbi:MAG TPA: response regulator [Nitrospirota bacterium]|nr:response regulator [Nitrospirota bacterium]